MSTKYVYYFGGLRCEGTAKDKNLLGGKGANLAEMVNIGIPVPPGFTISTEVCTYYYANNRSYPAELRAQIDEAVALLEKELGKKFGDANDPLLVSVRSGARVSMPGMMETILNCGLNDQTVEGLAKKSNNPRFAYDCYRRFIQMYAGTAMHADKDAFEHAIHALKKKRGVENDTDLSVDDLKVLVAEFKEITRKETGKDFPEAAMDQLMGAVNAVFGSWQIEKARTYRKINNIPEEWGTAVNVCSMVYGNMGDNSATGVAFTRDPSTGEKAFYGEYLINAQGEDVVAGIRTPLPVTKASAGKSGKVSLEEAMPKAYGELVDVYKKLESHYRDMQDIEFTIQEGKLWMLQTRNGKRTGFAAARIAVDLVAEGLLTPREAIAKIEPVHLQQLLAPVFDAKEKKNALAAGRNVAKGINASPGAACGMVALSANRAEKLAKEGKPALLVRVETSPEDIGGMFAANGILTARGGATSHAAVVARGMGKPCVCGASAIEVDYLKSCFRVGDKVVKEEEFVSIDGTTGEVILGQVTTQPSEIAQVLNHQLAPAESSLYQAFEKLMGWVDEVRDMGVRTNADTPEDARFAFMLGAEGIGLCRTEHMFFGPGRLAAVREMIVARDLAARKKALAKLLPFQRDDFRGLFEAMAGKPVTIRLLDPPLHEFLPHSPEQIAELAHDMGVDAELLRKKVDELHESNPMLGHRGCRLGVTYPEITEMQARAIFEAAAEVQAKNIAVHPEVMVPLVGHVKELRHQRAIIDRVAADVMKEKGVKIDYLVGTMIEVPRAALIADEIAAEAEFFSFGTNDLTQMTLGFSRDDAEKTFLGHYADLGFYAESPFQTLDQRGVGKLVRIGVEGGRAGRAGLKCGICGEHGGDPASVRFCHEVGLNYVSCSPFRVPIAKLAAAQAALANPRPNGGDRAAKNGAASKSGKAEPALA